MNDSLSFANRMSRADLNLVEFKCAEMLNINFSENFQILG